MFLTMLFSILYLSTNDSRYKEPMMKSGEVVYSRSELKEYVESATDKVKKEFPVLTKVAPVGYALGVRKQFSVKSGKVALPDTTTTYQYDHNSRSGYIGVEW